MAKPKGPRGPFTAQTLLGHVAKLPHQRASYKQLVKELGSRGVAREALDAALERLLDKGDLIEVKRDQFAAAGASREFATGTLRQHRDGYGFVVPERPVPGLQGDVFVGREEAQKAMHGDRVMVRLGRIGHDGRAEGEIVRVLRRAHATVVGEFLIRRAGRFVKPHDERLQQWLLIPDGMEIPPAGTSVDRVGLKPVEIRSVEDLEGKIVNVEILEFPEDGEAGVGRVIEILGDPDDFGVDVEVIIRKHHLPHQFPPEVLEQARALGPELPAEEVARRRDFREFDIVTIDGETARDFDDAVWVERLPNGHWALQVHIADVAYYVRPGTPIDDEAQLRGTSVYFPDRAIPMLPVELSTDLCSLRPNEDRLVMSALLEFDAQGEVVAQDFCSGIIRSRERMTYTHVHALLEGEASEELRQRYAALLPRFRLMKELALVLNRQRTRRGSIDFDLPEPLIEFDEFGQMTGVARSPRNIAHRLIEEFMLAANEAVAAHLEHAGWPSVYRIHEMPSPQKVAEFEQIAGLYGLSLTGGRGPTAKKHHQVTRTRDGRKLRRDIVVADHADFHIDPKAYQRVVAKLEGRPEERILSYLMLRSLKQARYSPYNTGHFALAAETYTHFTSPIRRYPDLLIHRILRALLEGRARPYDTAELENLTDNASFAERRAAEAERELVEWKKAKFMASHVGDEFEGMVISVTRFGFFVELDTLFVEGLVSIESLPGDRYLFQENQRKLIGERTRRAFSIGDRVRVRLDRVDAAEGRLHFSLAYDAPRRGRR